MTDKLLSSNEPVSNGSKSTTGYSNRMEFLPIVLSGLITVLSIVSVSFVILFANEKISASTRTTIVEENINYVIPTTQSNDFAYSSTESSFTYELPYSYDSELYTIPSTVPETITKSIAFCKNDNISIDIANAVYEASIEESIPEYVIYALIGTESSKYSLSELNEDTIMDVNERARSNYNCIGLTQVSVYALAEYNEAHGTYYKMSDLYDIQTNIMIGTWYYGQFRNVAKNWTEMYIIYNVGYTSYHKINRYWFKRMDNTWDASYYQRYFYVNDKMPPSKEGLTWKDLKPYNGKKRFEKCLDICEDYFLEKSYS